MQMVVGLRGGDGGGCRLLAGRALTSHAGSAMGSVTVVKANETELW